MFIPHSGCPHRCIYCNQKAVTGIRESMPGAGDLNAIVEHWLQYRRSDRGFTEISFYGGNFLGLDNISLQRLLDEASRWVKSGEVDGIRFSTRPDTVDRDRLNMLCRYPVSTVEIGVQSMNDRVLGRIKRGHSAADSSAAAGMLKKAGYRVGCQIMTGLPGENEKNAIDSALAVAELKPDFVRIYPLVVLAGSVLGAEYRAGRFKPLCLSECVKLSAALYRIFRRNRIPVIRIGLQASNELNAEGTILAGPYHPALGHIVLSRIMLEHAQEALDAAPNLPETVGIRVHPTAESRMRGIRNANLRELENKYPEVQRFLVRPDPVVDMESVMLAL